MTIKDMVTLKADVNAALPDNTTGDISPADVRSSMIDTVDSLENMINLSSFLASPDLQDETDATYFYYGWTDVSGSWLVQRQEIATGTSLSATITNNGTYADLSAAWTVKESLAYSNKFR